MRAVVVEEPGGNLWGWEAVRAEAVKGREEEPGPLP